MREFNKWYVWDEVRDVVATDCDAAIILDTSSLSQLEPALQYLGRAPRTAVIDHHVTHDAIGERDGDLRVFDDTASAACLIVGEWMKATGIPLDKPVGTALFTGIATDTGWFRFSNTDARTLRLAADLAEIGVEMNAIYRLIHQQDPLAKLRLISRLLDSIQLHADGKLAVMTLREEDFKATGADRGMTEELVNEATRLGCAEAVILFTEDEDRVRANFRSKRLLDVSALASRFGGGGHARAAGARLHGEWDKVVPRVIAETVEALHGAV
jgi:phosphoesterase RecJ-like protein